MTSGRDKRERHVFENLALFLKKKSLNTDTLWNALFNGYFSHTDWPIHVSGLLLKPQQSVAEERNRKRTLLITAFALIQQ